jgi:3-mercaptopyruvate sulfurtransferase SseA
MITSLSLVLSLAIMLGCQDNTAVANLSKPAATPATAKPASTPAAEKPGGDGKRYNNAAEVPRITVEEAKKAFDAGNAVFVDSRPEPAYQAEHILGAINIPSGANASEKFASLPKGKKIIVYCS